MRSGFATLVGRPNVGKSTLLNAIVGTKAAIVSDKPQTTRTQVRGVLTRRGPDGAPEAQLVVVDTPGVHKPRSRLGERCNATARAALGGVDVVCLVLDATAPVGRGDRWVAAEVPPEAVCAVTKVDAATRADVAAQLARAGELGLAEYFPVSGRTGEGVPELVDALLARLPEGPQYYPDDMVTDAPDAFWVAELVREQLLGAVRDELPHAIACRVTEWDWPRVRCEVLVERESQQGIVIGRGGSVLKAVGEAVRRQMPAGAYLELVARVDPGWSNRPAALDRLGY